jgi:hypothetical protein
MENFTVFYFDDDLNRQILLVSDTDAESAEQKAIDQGLDVDYVKQSEVN